MARPINCDMGHEVEVPAIMMVTDIETSDVVALCAHCWADLCAGVVRGTGGTARLPWEAEPEPEPEPTPTAKESITMDEAAADRQRVRTRRKLAARPDSAKTSAQLWLISRRPAP